MEVKKLMPACILMLATTALCAQTKGRVPAAQKADSVRSLKDVGIQGKYYRRYSPGNTSYTLKLNTPLLLLPQNIQIVDKSVIADQLAGSTNEAITRNVSGALRNNNADMVNAQIFMRGAQLPTLRNGFDVAMLFMGPMPEEAVFIDRAEVIKGPAGFLNAVGDPAGSFNIVTKKPTGRRGGSAGVTTGSFKFYRAFVDYEGFAGEHKGLQYRVNVAGQRSKSFQQFQFNNKIAVNPAVTLQAGKNGTLTAEYIYQAQEYNQYLATVFGRGGLGSLPKSFSITDPGKTPGTTQEHNGFLTYTQRLQPGALLTVRSMYGADRVDNNYFFLAGYNKAQPEVIRRRLSYERFNTQVLGAQAFVQWQAGAGAVKHALLGGLDANGKKLLLYGSYNDKLADGTIYPLNPAVPVYGIPLNQNIKGGRLRDFATNASTLGYVAAYVQDEATMPGEKIRITVALRVTHAKAAMQKPTESYVINNKVTPRLGLGYSITKTFTAYALYDNTFTPQGGVNTAGGTFKPLYGQNTEGGLKKDWLGGKLNAAVAFYYTRRKNIIVTDPVTNQQSQLGATRAKGFEADLKGELLPGLNVIANYAYTHARVIHDANRALEGKPLPFAAKHIHNAWLNYRLPLHCKVGIDVNAGYQLQAGRSPRYTQEDWLKLNNLFRVDAGCAIRYKNISFNAIINNVLNRNNYGSAWLSPTSIVPAEGMYAWVPYAPREFKASLGINF